jgi:hypothetical protein
MIIIKVKQLKFVDHDVTLYGLNKRLHGFERKTNQLSTFKDKEAWS